MFIPNWVITLIGIIVIAAVNASYKEGVKRGKKENNRDMTH